MRIRTGLFSLAALALAVLPAAAETARAAPRQAPASITLDSSSTRTITKEHTTSWGRNASGTADSVREQIGNWAKSIEETDRSYASDDVTRLHQHQVQKCIEATEQFLEATPEGYDVSVTAGGHAEVSTTEVRSDNWYVHLNASKPAAVAVS